MTNVLVTGAGGSAASNVFDSLRRARSQYRLMGADSSTVRLHLSSADERLVLPRANDPGYGDALRRAVDQWKVEVVLPQPDPEVLAVGAIRESVPAATYLPSQAALEIAADKAAFAACMSRAGVQVPLSRSFTDTGSVAEVTRQVLERVSRAWVRARRGAGARASLPVRSGEQAAAWVSWWVDEAGMQASDFMASEFLPGREFAYQSVWQDGELVAGQARQRVEYLYGHLTPHGQTSTPSVARTVDIPSVDATAMAAVRALDPRPCGVYCVDLKEGEDGDVKVTEINAGRFFTTSNFFAAAGLNMPDLLVRCALGQHPERQRSSPLPPDLYWIRMVDMGFILVSADDLDPWPRPD